MTAPTISPTTWEDVERNLSRLGYRFPAQVLAQVREVRSIFEAGALTPFIATPAGSPPLFLIKGPLFRREELQGRPMVEFVTTFGHTFPNAYPIITIEHPPPGNIIKRHPNVNTQGVCFLQSVSTWNPRNSTVAGCLKELYVALSQNFPFAPTGGPQSQPPPAQQPGPPHPPVPQQTVSMGTQIAAMFGARPAPTQQAAAPQQQQQVFNFSGNDFAGMLAGGRKPPGTVIQAPHGFGVGALVAGQVSGPMQAHGALPQPLPPVTTPTPDQRYQAEMARQQVKRQQQAPASGLTGLLKSVKTAAGDVKNAMESKVRDTVRAQDQKYFAALFPGMASEPLMACYPCSTLAGDGTRRRGTIFVTQVGVHFTTKTTDPPTPEALAVPALTFSLPLRAVACIALGHEGGRRWIHLLQRDCSIHCFFEIDTDWVSKIGSFAGTSLEDTPYDRLYNWLDHAWRGTGTSPAVPVQAPMPMPVQPMSPHHPAPTSPQMPVEGDNCCICFERARNCFLRPCGHVAVCMVCGSRCRECPLCRAPVQETLQAFL